MNEKIDLSINQIINPAIEVEVSHDNKNWVKRFLMSIDHRFIHPYTIKENEEYPYIFKYARHILEKKTRLMTREEVLGFIIHCKKPILVKTDVIYRLSQFYDFNHPVEHYTYREIDEKGNFISEPKKFEIEEEI